jgi:lipopolysaccharide/colanic/teichoic acid biosynthesis glycosyltransferase
LEVAVTKRVLEIVLSSLGLVVVSPVFLLAALAVKLNSDGPIFFRQKRIGRNFKPFSILKFRSMVEDAPQRGAAITAGDDPRITPVGRVLRATKIDELPQLINVLRGEMSLVGPRPEVPKYVELFRNDYEEILRIRPGITDPASLPYHDEAAILAQAEDPEREYVEHVLPEKIRLAKQYVARSSVAFDLRVIVATLACLVFDRARR